MVTTDFKNNNTTINPPARIARQANKRTVALPNRKGKAANAARSSLNGFVPVVNRQRQHSQAVNASRHIGKPRVEHFF